MRKKKFIIQKLIKVTENEQKLEYIYIYMHTHVHTCEPP